MAAPLLAVVAAIEAADLIFAVDSVPAVLAVSDDTFIVYTSNAFAILGLRALHFMPAGLLDRFHYLNKGLAIILAFIGVKLILQASHKMISPGIPEIPSPISLAVIVIVLAGSVVLSLPTAPRTGRATRSGPAGPGAQAPRRPAARSGTRELRGTPCCPGVVEGPAVVTNTPRDIGGGILLNYRTDPGWVAALSSAAALVIEWGGQLSDSCGGHGAGVGYPHRRPG